MEPRITGFRVDAVMQAIKSRALSKIESNISVQYVNDIVIVIILSGIEQPQTVFSDSFDEMQFIKEIETNLKLLLLNLLVRISSGNKCPRTLGKSAKRKLQQYRPETKLPQQPSKNS